MTEKLNKIYINYAKDVISGKTVACEAIILACKRFLSWFDRDDIYFDYSDVDYKIAFIHKLKHSTGQHNGQPFDLLPWQQFCLANIFGWKYNDTGFRVTRNVFIMIARKAGKTAFAAAIAICCALIDNEPGAEIELVANSAAQAAIGFNHVSNFCGSIDPKKKFLKSYRNRIEIPNTKSTIQVLCSESMRLDGYNASCFILDEFHAAKTWQLYNVMRSSQGMRRQPLSIVITTAGFLVGDDYPCFQYRKTCKEILRGLKQDDTQFSAIYELDDTDDWTDESVWNKCAPSLGQTVFKSELQSEVNRAKNNNALQNDIKTKNFNMFCMSQFTWIEQDYLQRISKHVPIEIYSNQMVYMGVDLSATSDLTAFSIMVPPDPDREFYPDKFIFKSFVYIPKEALLKSTNADIYEQWYKTNVVDITSGNVVDYDYILMQQKKIDSICALQGIYYDSWNATQWAINATNEGLPLSPYSQSIGNFNKPTKLLEMLIKSGKVIIDDNPCIRWAFNNCELKFDFNENCKPIKANGNRNNKIDPVIAMLEALGGYLNSPNYSPEVISV